MAEHVCSCHGTQCFLRNSRSKGWRAEGEGSRRKKEGGKSSEESGGHMSPLLLCALVSQAFVLNIDGEADNKCCPNTEVGW